MLTFFVGKLGASGLWIKMCSFSLSGYLSYIKHRICRLLLLTVSLIACLLFLIVLYLLLKGSYPTSWLLWEEGLAGVAPPTSLQTNLEKTRSYQILLLLLFNIVVFADADFVWHRQHQQYLIWPGLFQVCWQTCWRCHIRQPLLPQQPACRRAPWQQEIQHRTKTTNK